MKSFRRVVSEISRGGNFDLEELEFLEQFGNGRIGYRPLLDVERQPLDQLALVPRGEHERHDMEPAVLEVVGHDIPDGGGVDADLGAVVAPDMPLDPVLLIRPVPLLHPAEPDHMPRLLVHDGQDRPVRVFREVQPGDVRPARLGIREFAPHARLHAAEHGRLVLQELGHDLLPAHEVRHVLGDVVDILLAKEGVVVRGEVEGLPIRFIGKPFVVQAVEEIFPFRRAARQDGGIEIDHHRSERVVPEVLVLEDDSGLVQYDQLVAEPLDVLRDVG